MEYDVAIIGGGPVGCAAARDIAAVGYRVVVIEEHVIAGEPLQCAGLISRRALELSGVPQDVVLHRLVGARIHAPGGRILSLIDDRVHGLVIDRVAFDRALAAQASAAGAQIRNCTRVTGLNLGPDGVRVMLAGSCGEEISCRLVVGADGHASLVAGWLGLAPPRQKVRLYAAEVALPGEQEQVADIFLGSRTAPGWFGWVIPAGHGMARIGQGNSGSGCPTRSVFELLTEWRPALFGQMRLLRRTGGQVPIDFLRRTYGPRALLVGDAACHVKPISGGGLYLGLEAARLCAATAVAALASGDCSEEFLSRYQQDWEDKFGSEICSGLQHREIFLDLSDHEMDLLIAFLDQSYWRKIILKYGDLDYHSRLAGKLAFAPFWAKRFVVNELLALLNRCTYNK